MFKAFIRWAYSVNRDQSSEAGEDRKTCLLGKLGRLRLESPTYQFFVLVGRGLEQMRGQAFEQSTKFFLVTAPKHFQHRLLHSFTAPSKTSRSAEGLHVSRICTKEFDNFS